MFISSQTEAGKIFAEMLLSQSKRFKIHVGVFGENNNKRLERDIGHVAPLAGKLSYRAPRAYLNFNRPFLLSSLAHTPCTEAGEKSCDVDLDMCQVSSAVQPSAFF